MDHGPQVQPANRPAPRGRGASGNPANRFEHVRYERDPDSEDGEQPALKTQFLRDRSATIIAHNDSPDVPFESSINPYRGCEHGCLYCYARPFHEFLGFSAGLDFESKIMVKENAPGLLRKELSSPRWKPRTIAMSGVTDCYQPIERHLKITRRCLEVLADFRNPVGIVTKNHLITRDIDVLSELARHNCVAVNISVTTLDSDLARVMEPRTSSPAMRLEAIERLAQAKIPVGVMVAPVIPGLTDHEIPAIVATAANAGAQWAGHVVLRLPFALKDLFEDWLTRHFPDRREKVLNRIRAVRDGKLNDGNFGSRMAGQGIFADQIASLFEVSVRKFGLTGHPRLSTESFRRVDEKQLSLL